MILADAPVIVDSYDVDDDLVHVKRGVESRPHCDCLALVEWADVVAGYCRSCTRSITLTVGEQNFGHGL